MLFKTQSAAVYGIDANIIEVEVDIGTRQLEKENFQTVGLPDTAVRESRQRVKAALKNCGYDVPTTQITVNLAPVHPASESEEDRQAASRWDALMNRWFLDPIYRGDYPVTLPRKLRSLGAARLVSTPFRLVFPGLARDCHLRFPRI